MASCGLCGGIPADQETYIGRICTPCYKKLPMKCDFCADPDPCWRYPAKDFPVPGLPGHKSSSDWVACDPCHDLIEREAWPELLIRSLVNYEADFPGRIGKKIVEILRANLVELHRRFQNNRTGAPIRMGRHE